MHTLTTVFALLSALQSSKATKANTAATKTCVLKSLAGTPLLVGDVENQTIALTSASDDLTKTCDDNNKSVGNGKDRPIVLANGANNSIRAVATISRNKGTGWKLDLRSPLAVSRTSKTPISNSWNIYRSEVEAESGKAAIAQLQITTQKVHITSRVTAEYENAPVLTKLAAKTKSPNVVFASDVKCGNDFECDDTRQISLKNIAHLEIPNLGAVETWILDEVSKTFKIEKKNPATLPNAVAISATQVSSQPVMIHVMGTRKKVVTQTVDQCQTECENKENCKNACTVEEVQEKFELNVKLADAIEMSSLPLNVAEMMHVRCEARVNKKDYNRKIVHGDLVAVSNSTIKNDRCKLILPDQGINRGIARQNGLDSVSYTCEKDHHQPTTKKAITTEGAESDETLQVMGVATVPDKTKFNSQTYLESSCAARHARKGDEIAVLAEGDRKYLNQLKAYYGQQNINLFVYTDNQKRASSRQAYPINSSVLGQSSFDLNFSEEPDPEHPITIEAVAQTSSSQEQPNAPERVFRSRLRPQGPFGLSKRSGESRRWRLFATIPVDFAAVRFPASGLDIESTNDPTAVQLTTLTTGLLVTAEPWDYTRGQSLWAIPWRVQVGMLLSNWQKGVFHPSTYIGAAMTLPLIRGTKQLDTDLALGLGWEVDLRNGLDSFGARNHLLLTLGMNIFSLFGPQSSDG